MSCTIFAVPYALMWVVGTIAAAAAENARNKRFDENNIDYMQDVYKSLGINDSSNCDGDNVITEGHFIEKTFETPFMNRDILMKTLEEHGVINISEWDNTITGEVDNYKLSFEKQAADKPYNVRISCLEQNSAVEKINDLNSEYALNVQEDAYMHIIDKLKENNMQVESEEVMEDNTIVLTVNID